MVFLNMDYAYNEMSAVFAHGVYNNMFKIGLLMCRYVVQEDLTG